jgi:hypothetical protein
MVNFPKMANLDGNFTNNKNIVFMGNFDLW